MGTPKRGRPIKANKRPLRAARLAPELDDAIAARGNGYTEALETMLSGYLVVMDDQRQRLAALFPTLDDKTALVAATTSAPLNDRRYVSMLHYSIIDTISDQRLAVSDGFAVSVASLTLTERIALADMLLVWWQGDGNDPATLFEVKHDPQA